MTLDQRSGRDAMNDLRDMVIECKDRDRWWCCCTETYLSSYSTSPVSLYSQVVGHLERRVKDRASFGSAPDVKPFPSHGKRIRW